MKRKPNKVSSIRPGTCHTDVRIETDKWLDSVSNCEKTCRRAVSAVVESQLTSLLPIETSIVLADDRFVKDLNEQYRGVNAATNVLSFPGNWNSQGEIEVQHLGDIILAFETCYGEFLKNKSIAKFDHHICHLIVHGTLHLIGFDHEITKDAERMELLETRILARLNVPNPYVPLNSQLK